MSGRIFSRSFMQAILDSAREIRSLSDLHCHSLLGFDRPTPQLHLPEVRAPAQYLVDMGLRPALAHQLSNSYLGLVARYKKTCESYFDRATHGGCHLPIECYRDAFVALFTRTIQAWDSQFVSIIRVQLCQAGVFPASFCPERVDIRVDNLVKAEIIARLGLEAMPPTSDTAVAGLIADRASRVEEVLEQTDVLSTTPAKSYLMLPESLPVSSSTAVTSIDPFSRPAPPTCFPAPYPPPPEYSSSYSPQRALATAFVPAAPDLNVQPLTRHLPDVSSLTDLFGRMSVTALKTNSTNPKHHKMFGISEINKIEPVPPPITANVPKEPQLASIDSIALPPKSTTTVRRRRKIAVLPTRRGKTSASPSPPVFDSAGTTSYAIPRPYERIEEEAAPYHILTSPQKTRLVSTLPSSYAAEVPCFATPKSSTPRQRKVHTLRKTLPQTQPISQNQTLKPLATAGETFYNDSRSPPLVSDATSYFDSPPTSSDELDTPPSTPPSSHVLLASTSTESLAFSSEPDRIVYHKEPLGDSKLPYPRQRYRRLDFMKGGSCRDEQPLTFTFSV